MKNNKYIKNYMYDILSKQSFDNVETVPIQTKQEKEMLLNIMEKIENEEVYEFYKNLVKNIDITYLKNFVANAPYIKIIRHNIPKKHILYSGSYYNDRKIVNIYIDKKSNLYHELLHAASSMFSFDISGFNINYEEVSFGKGLNEGYTEILNQRYFNNKTGAYYFPKKLAIEIEKFYDDKKEMEKDYFNANIFKVISQLLKVMSLEEAIDIITDIDQSIITEDFDIIDYLKIKGKINFIKTKSKVKKIIQKH